MAQPFGSPTRERGKDFQRIGGQPLLTRRATSLNLELGTWNLELRCTGHMVGEYNQHICKTTFDSFIIIPEVVLSRPYSFLIHVLRCLSCFSFPVSLPANC